MCQLSLNNPIQAINIAPITLSQRKIAAYKSCEKLLCCLRYTVSFDWQAKMNRVPTGF